MSKQQVMEENKPLCEQIFTLKAQDRPTSMAKGEHLLTRFPQLQQQSQNVKKLLEDACKLKHKHAVLQANNFIANKSLKAKTAAYNKLMDRHERLKEEQG
ncbi:hypothetical protein HD553DRAFT_342446 [Filobasidium floriforme]|uniref:uncharacterized protein n=1 Tax=Filobasidium floriforme TaxID=5210 RepID=UPI001E8CD943|nr:uncharacterized protein HD553DRAFT_342446 [Filobasidium floriforme]KAH8084056.1 hypothetical protein HD553DRAFT_342446 [Filobasidium floriforme]